MALSTTPSENFTVVPPETHDSSSLRVVLIVIGLFLSVLSLYVVVALIVHRCRLAKRKKKLELTKRQSQRKSTKRKEGSSPALDYLSLASAVLAFLNCSSEHTVFYTKYTSNVACKVMQSFSFLFYAAGIACLYSFLWKRQRACYNSPTLSQMHSKFLRIISAAILPVFLVMMVAGICLTGVLWEFETSEHGCMETSSTRTPLVVLFTGSLAMQLTLLGLFVYPLKRHTIFQRAAPMITDKILTALVKRSIYTTGLCVTCDAVTFIIAVALPITTPFIVTNFLYDGNLLCNVLCVVGSFADWRQRMAPWCTKDRSLCDRRLQSPNFSSSMKTNTTAV
uniref:Uncharacterized protein LOC100186669 n=1 Tax=Phallusia mammillata TaxID=59560 RepID=A0A6F9DIQ2_9ASCI|nr:uncharacterized protein LOC100186669 [Phallusia mammillata]